VGTVPPPSFEDDSELGRHEPGASIEREYQRRKLNRERRARAKHPRVGGLLLWLSEEPQHQRAFQAGARGERTVGASLDRCAKRGPLQVLHNRRLPGGHGDIDHIAIAPSGVYVVDTKAVKGRVAIDRPLFGEARLLINGFDRTKYLDGLDRQTAAVRTAVQAAIPEAVPIQGVICFTEADLPGLRTAEMRGHLLMYQRALRKRVLLAGPLSPSAITALAGQLAVAFQAA
jgi:Nuclease-related domain